ncbi:MAG: allophycocyanin subunit alpha-B [Cyanobacteria bacterium J06639_1]
MSVINQVIETADDELRYPSVSELQAVQAYMGTGLRRLEIAQILTDNKKQIIDKAQKKLFVKHPDYIRSGGNAFGDKRYNQCLRDYDWYLRLITYGIISGTKEPIETIGLIGVREMYNALNVPIPGMVDAIVFMKEVALELLTSEDAAEASPYFDYVINAMGV